MTDIVVFSALVVAAAWLFTTHVSVAWGLVRRHPRWHGPVAFLVPPLAPFWAWREGMRVRAVLWLVGAVGYAIARFAAAR